MAINKRAQNIKIEVENDYKSISGKVTKVAEQMNIEATSGNLNLVSNNKIVAQGNSEGDVADFSNNNLNTQPLPTLNVNGFYYQKDGTFLGKIGGSNNVYITDNKIFNEIKNGNTASFAKAISLTSGVSSLNNDELLDRANWIWAEGIGSVPYYYAFSIQNSRILNRTEAKVYYYGLQDNTGRLDKKKYFSGQLENKQGKDFWDTREKPQSRTADMIHVISAVIKTVLYPQKDITNGCTGWLGYPDIKHYGEFCVKVKGRWHFFRIVGKKYKSYAPQVTIDIYEEQVKKSRL